MKKTAVAIVGLLGAASMAFGGSVVYETEGDFLAQIAPGFYLEDFDGFGFEGQGPSIDFSQGPWSYSISAPNEIFSVPGAMSTNTAYDVMTVDMTGADVYAVGGYFTATDFDGLFVGGSSIDVALSDGTFYSFTPTSATDFVGFVSDTPITSLSITVLDPGDGANRWATLDHFYVGGQIPAPGALALLGLAGVARRRRR